jgi:hypothetical protein
MMSALNDQITLEILVDDKNAPYEYSDPKRFT